jgi:hypothetical protein
MTQGVEATSRATPTTPVATSRATPTTPVEPKYLTSLLHRFGYPSHLVHYLHFGFTRGFSLNSTSPVTPFQSTNSHSATSNPSIVYQKIQKEISAGRVAGPFPYVPLQGFITSPLSLVPKKAPGEYRLIHNLSYPLGKSVNSSIPKEHSHVQYARVSDFIALLKPLGAAYMAKSDIQNAFRLIPVNIQDHHLLGFHWNGHYYYDKFLAMGASSSCRIFETFSTAIEFIFKHLQKTNNVTHVLDDFAFCAATAQECQEMLDTFQALCRQLGIPLAAEKTEGPTQTITFLGIELDTKQQLARLPLDKIQKCLDTIDLFLKSSKVTLKEMQSLIGLLNWACNVVVPGRAFLRRLIDSTQGIKKSHHRIRVTQSCKEDLRVWQKFLLTMNGQCFFLQDKWLSSESLSLTTDASKIGFGAP